MKNKLETPYTLSVQSVLNEFSKYAVKLAEAPELGVSHCSGSETTKLNTGGLTLSQDLKRLLLSPEFNCFIRNLDKIDKGILSGTVVLARPHNISLNQPTVKAAYELASMSLMLRNYCLMREGEYAAGSHNYRAFVFLKNLSGKTHDTSISIQAHILGQRADIMSHFLNSMSHENHAQGAGNGGN